MAFELQRFVRQTEAFNSGAQVVDTGIVNGPALYTYESATDTIAQIGTAGYFDSEWRSLCVGDFFICTGSDASNMFIVDSIDQTTHIVTLASFSTSGAVGTANIQDLAVTTAKIDDLAVTTGKIAANAVTSAKVDPLLIQHIQVDVALADFIGANTASVAIVPAPGANKKIVMHRATLHINYGGTVLAAGGTVQLQYADDANAGGTFATGTIAAATLIAATADTSFGFSPVDTTLVDSATLNEGLFLSAATQDFTGGTLSSYKVDVWYSVLDVA